MIDDLQYWHVTDGQITLSTERFKHGTTSLKWEWSSSSSSLTFTNPEIFHSIKWANNKCLAFWLYNTEQSSSTDENNLPQPLYIDFLTEKDSKPIAHIWYHVNFYGWRPLGSRYALLSQFKTNLSRIHGIRFYPPSNISNGVYYLNAINFDYIHANGPQSDYQQPWATQTNIKRLNDDPMKWLFNSKNIFFNRPWLEEQQINVNDEDINKIKERWINNLPYGTW